MVTIIQRSVPRSGHAPMSSSHPGFLFCFCFFLFLTDERFADLQGLSHPNLLLPWTSMIAVIPSPALPTELLPEEHFPSRRMGRNKALLGVGDGPKLPGYPCPAPRPTLLTPGSPAWPVLLCPLLLIGCRQEFCPLTNRNLCALQGPGSPGQEVF